MSELLMKQCLIAMLRQHLLRDGTHSPLSAALHHPRLARAVLSVIEQPAAAHSVESLATLAGMSRASFAEHFSRTFQQGPINFVQKVRLRIAARLLTTTDLPLKVIAQSIGYAGATSFSRAFRAAYGADPFSYRRLDAHDERKPEPLPDQSRIRLVDQRAGFAIRCWHRYGWVWHGRKVSGRSERRAVHCVIGSGGLA